MKTLFSCLLALFFAFLWQKCAGQNSLSVSQNDIWGEPACGLRMSISMSNNVITFGSNFWLTIKIENSSTNVINLGESTPETEFKVFLTDAKGQYYQLTPSTFASTYMLTGKLNPFEIRIQTMQLGIDRYFPPPGFNPTYENVPRGSYTLEATRRYVTKKGLFTIESNLLQVRVK